MHHTVQINVWRFPGNKLANFASVEWKRVHEIIIIFATQYIHKHSVWVLFHRVFRHNLQCTKKWVCETSMETFHQFFGEPQTYRICVKRWRIEFIEAPKYRNTVNWSYALTHTTYHFKSYFKILRKSKRDQSRTHSYTYTIPDTLSVWHFPLTYIHVYKHTTT